MIESEVIYIITINIILYIVGFYIMFRKGKEE